MNLDLLLPLLTSTLVALVGWFIGHRQQTERDQLNKRREVRLQFLIEAYRALEAAIGRGPLHSSPAAAAFERAIADLQLLGTSEQSRMAKALAQAIAKDEPDADAKRLLQSLRDDLRRELGLNAIGEPPVYFRIERADADGPDRREHALADRPGR